MRKTHGYPAVTDLGSITTAEGFKTTGEMANDETAWTGATGDINGDGINDFVVGSYIPNIYDGAAYVIFGQPGTARSDINLSALDSSNGYKISGTTGTPYWGYVSGADDFNGDGSNEILIGGPEYLGNGGLAILYGNTGALSLDSLTSTQGVILTTTQSIRVGYGSSGHGDLNGDGLADIAVAAPFADPTGGSGSNAGWAYVVFGRAGGPSATDLDALTTDASTGFRVDGPVDGAEMGKSLEIIDDVNGDGCSDLVVGSAYATGIDSAYVIYGGRQE